MSEEATAIFHYSRAALKTAGFREGWGWEGGAAADNRYAVVRFTGRRKPLGH